MTYCASSYCGLVSASDRLLAATVEYHTATASYKLQVLFMYISSFDLDRVCTLVYVNVMSNVLPCTGFAPNFEALLEVVTVCECTMCRNANVELIDS